MAVERRIEPGSGRFVEVALDVGALRPAVFTYHVPPDLALAAGHLVVVPLRERRVVGLVVRCSDEAPAFATRPVEALVRPDCVVQPLRIDLARWIAERYRAPFWDALRPMLPPRLGRELASGRLERRRTRAAPAEPPTGALALPRPVPDPSHLTDAQRRALAPIAQAVRDRRPRVFLLHGVTGSGKTHVYLEAAAEAIAAGQQAIVLVAEIALTPAAVGRFEARFPGRVAVLHSRLRASEHRRAWERIAAGEADLIVGARSALFAPAPRPGLIVLDEAHEWTYKQEQSPRYDARAVAVRLGELASAPVVLSSATPDVESYYRAQRGEFVLLELPERYRVGTTGSDAPRPRDDREPVRLIAESSSAGDTDRPTLPAVTIIDLRAELRAGHTSIFSRALVEAVERALAGGEQAILFLNRRGSATCVVCRDCGHVLRCRRCDLPLVYHAAGQALVCHTCNRRLPGADRCPGCGGRRIRYLGLGTQRVEQELQARFPSARVLRWDRDVANDVRAYDRLWRTFAEGEADLLVGTQMIAKALDFPRVTVVGVLLADTGLYLPDFRAAERTFQLLSQVAGRAGRGERPGRAIIQTYSPQHYAVQAAASHDFAGFFAREIAFRREHGYPPFRRLARLVYSASAEGRGWREAESVARRLRGEIAARGIADLDVLGPAPAFHRRVRGRYRWQIVLAGDRFERVLDAVPLQPGWTVDVDVASLL